MTGDELLNAYAEKFNEPFPLYEVSGTDEEITNLIKQCLDNGTPYVPENKYSENISY